MSSHSKKWDEEEKLRRYHIEIEFVGDHIHDLGNMDHCKVCGKTWEQIANRRKGPA